MQELVNHNHSFAAIPEYTLTQVVMLKGAIARSVANSRMHEITDLGLVIGSVFGSSEALSAHIDLLSDTAAGEIDNGEPRK